MIKRFLCSILLAGIFVGFNAYAEKEDKPSEKKQYVKLPSLEQMDLQEALVKIKTLEFDLLKSLEQIQVDINREDKNIEELKEKIDRIEHQDLALTEQLSYAQRLKFLLEEDKALLEKRLNYNTVLKAIWKNLNVISIKLPSPLETGSWKNDIANWREQVQTELRMIESKFQELSTDYQATLNRSNAEGVSSAQQKWIQKSAQAIEEHKETYEALRKDILGLEQFVKHYEKTLGDALQRVPLKDRTTEAIKSLAGFWSVEMFQVEEHSVTVGKVITALLFLIIGFFISKILSALLAKSLKKKTHVGFGAADSVQKLSFYSLLVLFALTSLKLVEVPLTAFAFLGGAVALGVGFGSQNIVNNFISGLILLIERPIKSGDYVDIDGVLGEIERIGARSTRVRTPDNIHLVIPNSTFLEKNVTNWTLSDHMIRANLSVGVIYGSPTDKVKELILKAINEHELTLEHPEPTVLFAHFGDNALEFDAYFWIRVHNLMDRRRIQSDIRFSIDHLFREHELVIAFPQKDVHLDTVKPLEIKVIGK